jgi:hypothetical protein
MNSVNETEILSKASKDTNIKINAKKTKYIKFMYMTTQASTNYKNSVNRKFIIHCCKLGHQCPSG